MTGTYTNQIQTGASVYSSDGEKIGDVAGIADNYFVIEKGFIFTTDIYVPMSAVSAVDDDRITLSMTKDQVESSDWSNQPDDDLGDRTADAYAGPAGTDTSYATRDTGYATGGASTDTSVDDEATLERREERLTVDKQARQTGEVRVGKHVVEEQQAVDVPVTREEVNIQRRSVDRPADASDAFTEDSIDVPVYEEEVVTGKEARVVEELDIDKTAITDTARVQDTVRREEFDIDEDTTGTSRQDR